MKVKAKEKEKVKLEEIEFGQTFRLINNINNYMRINLGREASFHELIGKSADIAYCVDLLTGDTIIFDKGLIVEHTNVVAKEM